MSQLARLPLNSDSFEAALVISDIVSCCPSLLGVFDALTEDPSTIVDTPGAMDTMDCAPTGTERSICPDAPTWYMARFAAVPPRVSSMHAPSGGVPGLLPPRVLIAGVADPAGVILPRPFVAAAFVQCTNHGACDDAGLHAPGNPSFWPGPVMDCWKFLS